MAFAYLGNSSSQEYSSLSVLDLAMPTGVVEGDLMLAFVCRQDATDPYTTPSGWTLAGKRAVNTSYTFWLYYRVAEDSEAGPYQWGYYSGSKTLGLMVAYRDGFDTADPIDVVSNSEYSDSDTTVRAASVSASADGSPAIFVGGCYYTLSTDWTPPSGFAEDYEEGGTAPDFWGEFASKVLASSGATGNIDATISNTISNKHGFLLVLNPSGGSPAPAVDAFLDGVWG